MNRKKIVDIAMKLPREAYIDLICAGVDQFCLYTDPIDMLLDYPNITYNQVKALMEVYREEGKEDEDE